MIQIDSKPAGHIVGGKQCTPGDLFASPNCLMEMQRELPSILLPWTGGDPCVPGDLRRGLVEQVQFRNEAIAPQRSEGLVVHPRELTTYSVFQPQPIV
jgi:hypothetical protein